MSNSLRDRLIKLVITNASDNTDVVINDNTDLIIDLSYDSISTIELIIDIEKEFNINFPEEFLVLEKIRCFSSLYGIVYECI